MKRLLIALSVLLASSASMKAQTPSGQILGVITDSSGAVVSKAAIVATNLNTNLTSRTISDEQGNYLLTNVAPGAYELSVQHEGFRTAQTNRVEVAAVQNVRLDIQLVVGGTTESVTVSSTAVQVDTRSETEGLLIDDRRVQDLPLNGRNVVDLAALTPGVSSVSTTVMATYTQQAITVDGGRQTSTNFLLDGAPTQFYHRGQGLQLPPPDAVQEFKVITSGAPAEYGRGFATLSAVTRSGTNDYHGSLWEFLRNNDFDARSFFQAAVPVLHFNQFGGTFGGPIRRNKTFVFLSYEGLRISQDEISSSTILPSTAERGGNFSQLSKSIVDPTTGLAFPGNIIPSYRLDPVALKVLGTYVPATANLPNSQYVAQGTEPTDGNQGIARVDHSFSDTDRLNFRYYQDFNTGFDPLSSSTFTGYSPIATSLREQVITAEDTDAFTPSLLGSIRANYTRFNYFEANTSRETLDDLGGSDFVHAGGPTTLPILAVSGFFTLSPGRDRQRLSDDIDLSGNLAWQHGRHQIKAGTDLSRDRFSYTDNRNTGGDFSFNGSLTGNAFADFILGKPVSLSQSSPIDTDQRYLVSGFFVQDTFRATERLTLSLGLRAELFPRWAESSGIAAGFEPGAQSVTFPTAPQGLIYQKDPNFPYQGDYNNLGPRVGLAWDVFGDGKTSVRAQYGIFYDGITAEQASGVLVPQPFGLNYTLNLPASLSTPYAGTTDPFPYVVSTSNAHFVEPIQIPKAVAAGVVNPSTQDFGASIQRQVTGNLVLDVAYVGTLGRHLIILNEENPAVYGPGATLKNTNARRLYAPVYASIGGLSSGGNSEYNALQVAITQRFRKGLTFGVAYTYSKAIDEAVSGENAFATVDQGGSQNPFNVQADRSLADFDQRHNLRASWLYELPWLKGNRSLLGRAAGGWEIGGLLTVQSGLPLSLLTGVDNSLTGVGFDRPNVVGNPNDLPSRSTAATLAEYFDTSAFAANAIGTYGDAGRNILTAPGLFNLNVSLDKRFLITERQSLQLRGDSFNVTNTPSFGAPGNTLTTPLFGRISSAGPGRVLQVSLKYQF
jgi:outer membrane receptor protein involved in Fe transport